RDFVDVAIVDFEPAEDVDAGPCAGFGAQRPDGGDHRPLVHDGGTVRETCSDRFGRLRTGRPRGDEVDLTRIEAEEAQKDTPDATAGGPNGRRGGFLERSDQSLRGDARVA